MQDRVVVVCGAGETIAEEFIRDHHVVILGRRPVLQSAAQDCARRRRRDGLVARLHYRRDVGTRQTPNEERVIVRSAREDDLDAVVGCMAAGALTEGREDPSDLEPYRRALAEAQAGASDVLVAEVDGVVVGVLQFIVFRHIQTRGGLCAELESVHVRSDRRGTGIGATLVTTAIERARALGCRRVQLTSNLARPDAHRFWERMGFVPSHVGYKLPLS